MDNLLKNVYEHLKTKKKYNKLKLMYDVKNEELHEKILELNEERKINKNLKNKFEEKLNEYIEENIKLKEELKQLKKKIKKKESDK